MAKFFNDAKFGLFVYGLLVVGITLTTLHNDSFASEEDSIILQTGIISTEKQDYLISSDFETRSIQEGKLIRIIGTTVDGYPYYAYQRTIGDENILYGKVIINGEFVPVTKNNLLDEPQVIESPEIVPETTSTKPDMLLLVQHSEQRQYGYSYTITAKVFDASINSDEQFYSFDGLLEGVKITVTVSDSSGNVLTSFEGLTDSAGQFNESYLWGYKDLRGTYDVEVIADNGETTVSKTLETTYLGYIKPKDNP